MTSYLIGVLSVSISYHTNCPFVCTVTEIYLSVQIFVLFLINARNTSVNIAQVFPASHVLKAVLYHQPHYFVLLTDTDLKEHNAAAFKLFLPLANYLTIEVQAVLTAEKSLRRLKVTSRCKASMSSVVR